MMQMIRKSWWGRAQVATLASAMTLTTAMPASAASRVNVMPDRQVRPGVSLPVFGSADGGVGAANGQIYAWTFAFNAAAVSVATDGSTSGVIANDRYIVENVTFTLLGGSTAADRRRDAARRRQSRHRQVGEYRRRRADGFHFDAPLEDLAVDVNISIEEAPARDVSERRRPMAPGSHLQRHNVENCGTTALCYLGVFQQRTIGQPTRSANDIYSEWVQKAVDWILTQTANTGAAAGGQRGRRIGQSRRRLLTATPTGGCCRFAAPRPPTT